MTRPDAATPCQGALQEPFATRARLLAWLADGPRDLAAALCSLPRERWTRVPPEDRRGSLGEWPALRHVRHVALYAERLWLPSVRVALGTLRPELLDPIREVERQDAAWDSRAADDRSDDLLQALADTRFTLLELLESAPDDAWLRPLPRELAGHRAVGSDPVRLGWLVTRGYQHEVEHLSALWKLVLYWDRVPAPTGTLAGVRLQPADRMESH